MKIIVTITILSFISVFSNCKVKEKPITTDSSVRLEKKESPINTKEIEVSKVNYSKDSIIIYKENDLLYKYSKSDFNDIIKLNPELLQDSNGLNYAEKPEILFEHNNNILFTSEEGMDTYYVLYAHFLKQKNGNEKYQVKRKQFIELYRKINQLFSELKGGGNYFTHQNIRIIGYAEYSVYNFKESKNKIDKKYDIKKQKELYIKSLRQLIDDEVKKYPKLQPADLPSKYYALNKIVDHIDKFITDLFMLRQAQEFQYSNYKYY